MERGMARPNKNEIPFPPIDLIKLVTGGDDVSVFDGTGAADLDLVRRAVAEAGFNPKSVPCRVLDWGCGCGRIARHWDADGGQIELFGCDINPALVNWSRENIPWGAFTTCELLPPLSYPDQHFDLVYGVSVLTHLTFEAHFLWMQEIWRVLKPGGMAILTTHGPTMLPNLMHNIRWAGSADTSALLVTLIDEEMFACVEREGGSNATGNVLSSGMFGRIFHPFDIRYCRPRNGLMGIQDTYVLAKKAESSLRLVPVLLESEMQGADYRAEVALELHGERHLSVLVESKALYFPATIRLSVHRSGDAAPLAMSDTVILPDKAGWTRLDAAHVLVTLDNLPAWNGPVVLSIDVNAKREGRVAFEGLLPAHTAWPPRGGPLDGAKLRLTKATLF